MPGIFKIGIIAAVWMVSMSHPTWAKSEEPGAIAARSTDQKARGEEIAETMCALCHSIGRTGESPHETAPPFREIFKGYPEAALSQKLEDGIGEGHGDMPSFNLGPEEVEQLLSYIYSILYTDDTPPH